MGETTLNDAMQEDLAELLRVLGLGDHARDKSPHEVMRGEVIPVVRRLMGLHLEGWNRSLEHVHAIQQALAMIGESDADALAAAADDLNYCIEREDRERLATLGDRLTAAASLLRADIDRPLFREAAPRDESEGVAGEPCEHGCKPGHWFSERCSVHNGQV